MEQSATPAPLLTEAMLIEGIRRGDRAAESELVSRYSRGVLNMIRHHSPEHAEDVHQETFRAVLERLRRKGLEDPEQLNRYIVRTAKNILQNIRRSVARGPAFAAPDFVEEFEDHAPGPLEQLTREQLAHCVRRVLADLGTQRDRVILHRFYIEEIDKEQICAELGLDSLHFNRVLHRARERFRELVLADNIHYAEFGHES